MDQPHRRDKTHCTTFRKVQWPNPLLFTMSNRGGFRGLDPETGTGPPSNAAISAPAAPSPSVRTRVPIIPSRHDRSDVGVGTFCPIGSSASLPANFRGRYFFADFVNDWIEVLDPVHPEMVDIRDRSGPAGGLGFCARRKPLCAPSSDAWLIDANFRPGTGSLSRVRPKEMPRLGA